MLQYIITIRPLGLLYGSAGPFMSPENLVGRAGNHFPPSTTTLGGLYASPDKDKYRDQTSFDNLKLVGPFWAMTDAPEDFYVPTPLTCQIKLEPASTKDPLAIQQGKVTQLWNWQHSTADVQEGHWYQANAQIKKADSTKTWVCISDWPKLQALRKGQSFDIEVKTSPWQYLPHLHPRLELEQRRVAENLEQGSLFLENAVQMHPDTCLVYLASQKLTDGWYRFGGEGHMVEVECIDLFLDKYESLRTILEQPVGDQFALLTPAAWGTQRFSYRYPMAAADTSPLWQLAGMMTNRPQPQRFLTKSNSQDLRFSRGRYVVPASTVYVLDAEAPLSESWLDWPSEWFPHEGSYSYQRWGSGFALPL
jgi:CRISPR-associated protein Cmr3